MGKLCSFVMASGRGCRSPVGKDGGLCLFHDAARARKASEARSKGAATTNAKRAATAVRVAELDALPNKLESLEDAAEFGSWIVIAVTTGVIDARTAAEASRALRVYVDSQKHVDKSDERFRALEKKLAELRDAGGR
jgi:antirestriction protein ArdC